jgi:hypothetical protein
MVYTDDKRQFLNKFLKYFKEWQSLNQKVANSGFTSENAILDVTTAQKIFGSMNINL